MAYTRLIDGLSIILVPFLILVSYTENPLKRRNEKGLPTLKKVHKADAVRETKKPILR